MLITALVSAALAASPSAPAPAPAAAPRPAIRWSAIPFPRSRLRATRAYARRHYGIDRHTLPRPRHVVQHVTAGGTYRSVWNYFSTDEPDPELHERPGLCAHFVIDRDGTIHQLVNLGRMCRHVIGLNHVSIGIEHVARTDAELMSNRRQLRASLRLTRWLMGREAIPRRDVIGHAESLGSRFYRERVKRLRGQTHGDMSSATMRRYRRRL